MIIGIHGISAPESYGRGIGIDTQDKISDMETKSTWQRSAGLISTGRRYVCRAEAQISAMAENNWYVLGIESFILARSHGKSQVAFQLCALLVSAPFDTYGEELWFFLHRVQGRKYLHENAKVRMFLWECKFG